MTMTGTEGRQMVRAFVEHEHGELVAGIGRIHDLATDLPALSIDQASVRVARILRWVDETIRPHMAWEESWLFPQIDERAQTPWATRLARFDHRQILEQAAHLQADVTRQGHGRPRETTTLIADLSGLEALMRASIEREERLLLPLLDGDIEPWTPEWRD
jgi:iron-sulfur cluster repair protein YtfE (RIC family)